MISKSFRTFFCLSSLSALYLFSPLTVRSADAAGVCQNLRNDINRDGIVNLFDVAIFATYVLKPQFDPNADINQDGKVDIFDFHGMQMDFMKSCKHPTPVPSPVPTVSPLPPSPSSVASPVPTPVPTPSPTPRPTPSPTPVPTPVPTPSASPQVSSRFTVNDKGMISDNGKAYFPFGFSYLSDMDGRYGNALAQDVEKMINAGFNVIQMSIAGDNGLSDTAAAREKMKGKMLLIGSYYKPSTEQQIAYMKNDPLLMAWNTGDDFNVPYPVPSKPPSALKTYNDQIKGIADRVGAANYTYGSGGGYPFATGQVSYLLNQYKDSSTDFFAIQSYPIGNNDDSFKGAPLEENLAYYRYSRQQLAGRPVFANLQTFAWQNDNGGCGRFPNSKELRNMLYAGVMEGMNGIVAYAYHEQCGLRTHAAEWQEMVNLRQEVNGSFLNAIMSGNRVVRDTAALTAKLPGRIHATFWTTTENGKKVSYVSILNTNQSNTLTTNAQQNQIELPDTWSNPRLTALFSDQTRYPRTIGLQSSGGKWYLNGTIGAQDVQVYKIEE